MDLCGTNLPTYSIAHRNKVYFRFFTMKKLDLSGSFVALVTPFKNGEIDEDAIRKLVEFHVNRGTNGIVPCGTTGESPTLSHEEHNRVVDVVVQEVRGRMFVLAGTGSNNTLEAISLTKSAVKAGADGCLLVTPYYNRPTQEGLFHHYMAIAEEVDIALVPYSIQGRTGVNMEPELVQRLAESFSNIVGIKEASGNLNQMSQIIRLTGPSFQLTSGDDSLTLPVLAIGGVGVISVLANICPFAVWELVRDFNSGRIDQARQLHYRYWDLMKALFIETNPVPVKTAMGMLGLCSPEVRQPLWCLSQTSHNKLFDAMRGLELLH